MGLLHHYNHKNLHIKREYSLFLRNVHNCLINPHKTSLFILKDPKMAILSVEWTKSATVQAALSLSA